MHLTGGQPARGTELGVVKYRNTRFTRRNFFVQEGQGFYLTEYHKARAITNHSFYVARFLPDSVAQATVIYLTFIRPFASMIKSRGKTKVNDVGYIFCSDKSPDKCWSETRQLSGILKEESVARMNVSLHLRSHRHIVIAITKLHVKDIAACFGEDPKARKEALLKFDVDFDLWAWQAGHQRETNAAVYATIAKFPHQFQPELLRLFRHLSQLWWVWVGLASLMKMINEGEQGDRVKKRKIMVESETQTTPKKNTAGAFASNGPELGVTDSPETKRLKGFVTNALNLIETRKVERELRAKLGL